jgi:CHAT domain-containing protein
MFVPIHAAGIYTGSSKECCSDYLVSSYAPTLSALLKARNNLSPIPRAHVQAVLIAEPAAPGLEPLHNVEDEVRTVGHMLTSASVNILDDRPPSAVISFINEQGTTIENVKKRMSHANILHLACHGLQDPLEPLKSGFYLRDGCLSVSEIMRLDLHRPVFAFLSACETAKGDKKHPDQFVHLAAAMLFAGYRSIVATMW